MKAVVGGAEFADAVAAAARVVPKRPYTPVLGGLLVEVADDSMTVSATDFDTSLAASMPASVGKDGRALLAGPMLAAIAAQAKSADTVHVGLDDGIVTVGAGRARWQVSCIDDTDWPGMPGMPESIGTVSAAEWSESIAQTAPFCMALKDGETPNGKHGVQVVAGPDGARLLSSDGIRLSERDLTTWEASGTGDYDLLLPPSALGGARLSGPSVTLHADEMGNVFGLSDDRRRVILRPLATRSRVPAGTLEFERPHVLRIDRDDLLAAVKDVAIAADQVRSGLGTAIHVKVSGGELGMQVVGDGAASTAACSVDYDGPDLAWLLGPHLLLDVLVHFGSEVYLHSPGLRSSELTVTRALLLTGKPLDGSPNFRHLVMPRKR
ncbi:MAG: hypothetical protein ACRDT8_00085 [Micromonosporaceae bacterium]